MRKTSIRKRGSDIKPKKLTLDQLKNELKNEEFKKDPKYFSNGYKDENKSSFKSLALAK